MPPDRSARASAPSDAPPTATAVTASEPRTILNRYELLEPIGSGGMGEVFLAYDRSLKREVAIKVLASSLAGRSRFAHQMLREARAIAQLHHPHIATIYDVVDDGGSVCIVMEYLRGETLASRLRRRPLPYDEAIRHGCEIARALDHAHGQGIVHCDLKPGNIFITENDGIKVVDFGLARVLDRAPDAPTEGIGASPALIESRAGTPRYMSPEQRRGLPLDHRTDIYSFGVVLQEMFTGTLPGSPGSAAASPAHVSSQRLPPAALARLTPLFDRTLAPDADDRFQNAGEIEQALEGLAARGHRRWSRAYTLVAAGLAVLVGGLLAVLGTGNPQPLAGSTPAVVAVSRLLSNPGDTSMSYLAAGLSEMVAGDLAASNAVVPARSDVGVSSVEDARALARELGASAVVLGKVERTDAQVVAAVRVFTAGNQSFSESLSISRPGDDLLGIRRSLTSAVRNQLSAAGVRFRDSAQGSSNSAERLLPATMDSFEEYAQARWFLERVDVDANIDFAIGVLERIVAREPAFALAHAAMGEATWRKWQATKEPVWSERALRHALEALRLSANQPEVRYAVALIYNGTGRKAEALSELEEVARTRPTNDDVQRLMGRLYADSGRLDEGMKALHRAIDLRPGYWTNHSALGYVAFRAGRYPQAISAYQRVSELRPDSASAHQRLGTVYHAAGNLQAALQSYERALQIAPNANAYSNVGTAHFDAGRYHDAVKAYSRAVELEPRNASLHRNLADALAKAGDTRRAAEAYSRVVALATDALRVDPKDASTLSLKAVALARTGRLAEASDASAAAVKLAPTDNDVLFEHALILTILGKTGEALEMLERAVAAGYSPSRLASHPNLSDLSSLAGLPRFRALVARKP